MTQKIRMVEVGGGKLFLLAPKGTDSERKIILAAVADEMTWKAHHTSLEIELFEIRAHDEEDAGSRDAEQTARAEGTVF